MNIRPYEIKIKQVQPFVLSSPKQVPILLTNKVKKPDRKR